MQNPFETQVGGDHYKKMPIQPAVFCHLNGIPKLEGDVIAYVARWRDKNGLEDLLKARHTLDILIYLAQTGASDVLERIAKVLGADGDAAAMALAVENMRKEYGIDHKAINEAHVELDGPWRDHHGVCRPCRGQDVVRVRFRNGSVADGLAEEFLWNHGAPQPDDIVGWQLLAEKASA